MDIQTWARGVGGEGVNRREQRRSHQPLIKTSRSSLLPRKTQLDVSLVAPALCDRPARYMPVLS